MAYQLIFSDEAREHLRGLTANQRGTVVDAIAEQLSFEPAVQTRNRKLMGPNDLAEWELRVGNLRVHYDVFEASEIVEIVAIGVKEGNRIYIAGYEVEL